MSDAAASMVGSDGNTYTLTPVDYNPFENAPKDTSIPAPMITGDKSPQAQVPAPEPMHPEQVLREYTPTWRDRLGAMLSDATSGSPEAKRFVSGLVGSTGLGDTGTSVADFVPGVSNVLSGQEAAQKGDWKGVASAVVPVPGGAAMREASPIEDALAIAARRGVNDMGLYSHAAEVASQLPQASGTPAQMRAMLVKAGVKPDELHWSGFDQRFGGADKVTRDELAQHFAENVPQLTESVKGGNQENSLDQILASVRRYNPEGMSALEQSGFRPAIMDRPDGGYHFAFEDLENGGFNSANEINSFDDVPQAARNAASELEDAFQRHGSAESSTKFQQYTLPGGENYREVVMQLPNTSEAQKLRDEAERRGYGDRISQWPDQEFAQRYRDVVTNAPQEQGVYKSSHWDEPNPVAHLRMSDRTGDNGEKVLHLEELQSDWGQEARKKGIAQPSNDDAATFLRNRGFNTAGFRPNVIEQEARDLGWNKGVPSAPYIANAEGKPAQTGWVDLALKRALREAALGGYDRLAWTPGEEQAARYDLSKQISRVAYDPENKELSAHDIHGNRALNERGVSPDKLPDYIGKEAAEKLLNTEPSFGVHLLEGQDLKVGGEGMKTFYDKIVPTQLTKLTKKLDPSAKVEPFKLDTKNGAREMGDYLDRQENPEFGYKQLHSIPITPTMRANILKGLPAYAIPLAAGLSQIKGDDGRDYKLTPVNHDPFDQSQLEDGNTARGIEGAPRG